MQITKWKALKVSGKKTLIVCTKKLTGMAGLEDDKQIIKEKKSFSILGLANRAGLDGFILTLIAMILLAWLWPEAGEKKSPLHLTDIANYGVSLIFFFYGLRLNTENLKTGLIKWRLHLVVHFTTFIIFPLLVLSGKILFERESSQTLWLGVFFLASLPSTVSSSVVMVSIAGGNVPAAIFNASISSLLGVFITPLWIGLVIHAQSDGFDLYIVIAKLTVQVLVPVILGMLLHKKWGRLAEKNKKQLRYFDQTIILLIVYTSFCESFVKKMFSGFNISTLLIVGASMIGLFLLVYNIVKVICMLLGFNREDRITAVFCASKKSLVHGLVMSRVLFSGSDMIGIVLLPLMIYHALQLIAASIIAQSMAKN
ncbi:MAG: bile acid:sodium symporter family protein [Chitinophagaceae bacterium]